jgi:hypothetical protein
MDSGNHIEIIDKEGWRREFTLDKRLIYIGSDNRNDIMLSPARGAGVSPRHLQLIAVPGASRVINAVNLSASSIPLGESGSRILDPNSAMEVADGESFHLGDFTLTIHLTEGVRLSTPVVPAAGEPAAQMAVAPCGTSIGLRISLPQPVINPDLPAEGIIYVSNQGSAPGVQFKLWIEGLPSDCYEISPAPILFPGAEKGIPFRIIHPRRPGFAPGTHSLSFKAEAPEPYPGENAVVNRDIRFLPFYSHTLRLLSVD